MSYDWDIRLLLSARPEHYVSIVSYLQSVFRTNREAFKDLVRTIKKVIELEGG